MEITSNIHPERATTKLNALFWFAGVGGRAVIIFIVPGHIRVTNCWPDQIGKIGKGARWSIHHTQTTKEEEKVASFGTDLDRRWGRRRWIRKGPIGRRWLYSIVVLRKSRIELTLNLHWRERRHCCCWALLERRTACAGAVASIRAIATCSSWRRRHFLTSLDPLWLCALINYAARLSTCFSSSTGTQFSPKGQGNTQRNLFCNSKVWKAFGTSYTFLQNHLQNIKHPNINFER